MKAWQGVAALAAAVALGCETPLDLQLVPADDDFGAVAVGATSAPHLLTLSNAGTEATQALSVELSDQDAPDFALLEGSCLFALRHQPPYQLFRHVSLKPMQARDEGIVGSNCLVEFAETAAAERVRRREIESSDCCSRSR